MQNLVKVRERPEMAGKFIVISFTLCFAGFIAATTLEQSSDPEISENTMLELGFGSSLKKKSVVRGNSTISSKNGTFELGFFTPNGGTNWYVGIWYKTIPIRTYVWVANRENPVKNLTDAVLELTENGTLRITDSVNVTIWETEESGAERVKLLENGNLVLLTQRKVVVWQSFDFPADTWLPGMNVTTNHRFTCWKSLSDPAPGNYSLRLKSPGFGEFVLVWNGTQVYWSSGVWTGKSFTNIPEMTVPYIYSFVFMKPFTPEAYFVYTQNSPGSSDFPLLSRFSVDSSGLLKQYTWSSQGSSWNMFWSRPENQCRVYGLCGGLGFCNRNSFKVCQCLAGFWPVDISGWNSGCYSSGCTRAVSSNCENDQFDEVGAVTFTGATIVSFSRSRELCKQSCLRNCSCLGLNYNSRTNECRNLYGTLLNLQNLTVYATDEQVLHIRVSPANAKIVKKKNKTVILIVVFCSFFTFLTVAIMLLVLKKKKTKRDEEAMPVTNLKVFSYRQLYSATKGFSEKLGHGGFGAVFRGDLPDSTSIAVKRLERPDSGEKEFRMEVCTIGTIQHVNLVRLRGFCSENSRRALVYDYMQNGSLAEFLRQGGPNLDWETRFRIAVGTARAIAYLHEECRDCIIHCDIKPENILLDGDFTAKVSDFGLAKLMGREFSRVLTTMRGTRGYLAPEWISGLPITAKADVYSYGMTLLEIIGGRRNVDPGCGNEVEEREWFFPPWAARQIVSGNVAVVVDTRLAGVYESGEAERAGMVAVWCIQDEEGERPAMGTVVKMLEGTVAVEVPPAPKSLQALVADSESLVNGESLFSGAVSSYSGRVSAIGNGGSESSESDTDLKRE